MDLVPGASFGRYTIESELGRGGMGRVMLATDRVLHRKVALKMLHSNLLDREEIVPRFFREARLAAQLTHPNTVHVYDLGEEGGVPFIVMEYVEGKPLTSYLGDDHVPPERRMAWLVDVARGLRAAHARGLLHRDVKPANVMISVEGLAKVLDFGLAKKQVKATDPIAGVGTSEARPPTLQTAAGFLIGTPMYMAPEQLEALEIDARADQFGWALTAYALMLGKNLRKDDPLLFGPIPLLSDRFPTLSRRAAEIVLRALSHDREMRFPSMDALLTELEPALAEPASVGRPARDRVGEPSAPVSTHPTPLMAAAPNAEERARRFCPDCGLSVGLPSTKCTGAHAPAFPRPPGMAEDDEGSA